MYTTYSVGVYGNTGIRHYSPAIALQVTGISPQQPLMPGLSSVEWPEHLSQHTLKMPSAVPQTAHDTISRCTCHLHMWLVHVCCGMKDNTRGVVFNT